MIYGGVHGFVMVFRKSRHTKSEKYTKKSE